MIGAEGDEVHVIAPGFEENQFLAAILVEIARDDVAEPGLFDRGLVAVEFTKLPNRAIQPQPAGRIQAKQCNGRDGGLGELYRLEPGEL